MAAKVRFEQITHTGTTSDTETLSVRFEYAIIPFPV